MNPKVHAFARKAIWALPVWAATLVLGTLTHQPDPQTEFANFAAYVTTNQFLISHLVNSILGAAIGSIGIIGLMLYLQDSRAAGKAITAMVATVLSNTLNAAAFGAAAFAQPALGRAFLAGNTGALEIYNLVYGAPIFGTIILALVLLLVGGVTTGIAIAASGYFPRWAGWLYAAMIIASGAQRLFVSGCSNRHQRSALRCHPRRRLDRQPQSCPPSCWRSRAVSRRLMSGQDTPYGR